MPSCLDKTHFKCSVVSNSSQPHGLQPASLLWSVFLCPPPGNLLDPRIEPVSPMSPALAGGFPPVESLRKPLECYTKMTSRVLSDVVRFEPKAGDFFFFFSGHDPQHLGFHFLNQGLNLGPVKWKHSLNHWTTREVPISIFKKNALALVLVQLS